MRYKHYNLPVPCCEGHWWRMEEGANPQVVYCCEWKPFYSPPCLNWGYTPSTGPRIECECKGVTWTGPVDKPQAKEAPAKRKEKGVLIRARIPCPVCGGTGMDAPGRICMACSGSGRVDKWVELSDLYVEERVFEHGWRAQMHPMILRKNLQFKEGGK